MNKRQFFIQAHLIMGSLFLPLMLLLPLSGVLYLSDLEGEMTKTEAFRIAELPPEAPADQESFFREQFKKQNIDYKFESLRARGDEFNFNPRGYTHYVVSKENGGLVFYKVVPSFLKRLNELHTGHGKEIMRVYEVLCGFAMILIALSGIWLAATAKAYRKPMLISFSLGCAIIIYCLF
jgi:hypothetical protein